MITPRHQFCFTFHYVSILIVYRPGCFNASMTFTFHYVSILIACRCILCWICEWFTFHYVSILIGVALSTGAWIEILHSIMFLFQLTDPFGFSSSAPSFTSHYISILILKAAGGLDFNLLYIPLYLYFNSSWNFSSNSCTTFTFHYVSILICVQHASFFPSVHISIPLCLYSNRCRI